MSLHKSSNAQKFFNHTMIGLFYLFLYLPLLVLILFSFNEKGFPAPWSNLTLRWYQDLFSEPFLWSSLKTSLIVAFATVAVSLFLGISLIYYAVQGGKINRIVAIFFGNLIVPEIALAVSLLGLFSTFSIPLGYSTLVIAHSILGLGIVVPILYSKYIAMDRSIVEASLNLGASPMRTFFYITLPFLRPAIVACSLLVFILSFDDFTFSYFCSGSSTQTLPLYIISSIRTGLSPILNALSVLIIALTTLFALLFFFLNKRSRISL